MQSKNLENRKIHEIFPLVRFLGIFRILMEMPFKILIIFQLDLIFFTNLMKFVCLRARFIHLILMIQAEMVGVLVPGMSFLFVEEIQY